MWVPLINISRQPGRPAIALRVAALGQPSWPSLEGPLPFQLIYQRCRLLQCGHSMRPWFCCARAWAAPPGDSGLPERPNPGLSSSPVTAGAAAPSSPAWRLPERLRGRRLISMLGAQSVCAPGLALKLEEGMMSLQPFTPNRFSVSLRSSELTPGPLQLQKANCLIKLIAPR